MSLSSYSSAINRMLRLSALTFLLLFFIDRVLPAWAWNGSGHTIAGAIAYQELKQKDAIALDQVIAILKANPEYETLWLPHLAQVEESEPGQLLFMLAARWSDDIRRDERYDRPQWHYINLPYKPTNEPDSILIPPPDSENILTAFEQNLSILTSNADDSHKAIALCWLFHLVGDVHQPLHTTNWFVAISFFEFDYCGLLI